MDSDRFPSSKGSYLLWFYLPRGAALTIGKLGYHHFSRGWYLYCGSAFGPGGLRARLGHHLKSASKFHWHIDYLNASADLRSIWFCVGHNFEHRWSRQLVGLSQARYPLTGFGSSDCRCPSHLIYFSRKPGSNLVLNELGSAPRIYRKNTTKAI